jgi:hypothetical protein
MRESGKLITCTAEVKEAPRCTVGNIGVPRMCFIENKGQQLEPNSHESEKSLLVACRNYKTLV